MSEEAPKKRGRPRKVTATAEEPSVVVGPVKQTVTKGRTATAKTIVSAKAKKNAESTTNSNVFGAARKEPVAPNRVRKTKQVVAQDSEFPAILAAAVSGSDASSGSGEIISQPQLDPAGSRILSQVRELEELRASHVATAAQLDGQPMSIHPTASLSSSAPSKPKVPLSASKAAIVSGKATAKTFASVTKPSKAKIPTAAASQTASAPSSSVSKQSSAAAQSSSASKTNPIKQAPLKTSPSSTPASSMTPSAAQKPTPPPQPYSPPAASSRPSLAAMNSQIVNNITARSGARPGGGPAAEKPLPANYKQVARRATWAIVAAPVAIVTSYFLWQRLAMGQERKHLGRPNVPVLDGAAAGSPEEAKQGPAGEPKS